MGKYNFPKIEKVIIRNFSLYTKDGEISVLNEKIKQGVYCLAGANGLGKTTFLNAINYGLTGVVLAPQLEVYSPQEINKNNKRYTDRYFTGRVKEKDKANAEIELLIRVNHKYYKIIRGFFESNSLRDLEIFEKKDGKKISILNAENFTPKELKEQYEKEIAKDVCVKSFEYYMFLQLYVFTFDENRRMIFWDDRASSVALSISFNTSMEDTENLIKTKRLMEKLESDGRNSRWQATQILNKIKKLIEAKEETGNQEELEDEYRDLIGLCNNIDEEYHNVRREHDTMLKTQSHLHSEIVRLRLEHTKLFSIYSEPRSKLLENTYVKMFMKKNECLICGAKSEQIIQSIKKNLYKDNCPLCTTRISDDLEQVQTKILDKIANNDRLLSEGNQKLEKLTLEAAGKKAELDKVEYELYETKEKITEFKNEHSIISINRTGDDSVDLIINKYEEQFVEYDFKAKEKYKQRDRLKPEYNILQEKITNAYKEAEIQFVPIFQKLAKSFIGYDLNISFTTQKREMKLVLELNNSARTESSHLSESQRFFLDIALRMALAIYLSKKDNAATMFIDTPEGSLDIAYESRVGEMFARFVMEYQQNILMTANINASQLLLSLANKCRAENMQLRRMLEWTDLSIIQKEGENLFVKVFDNIESELNGNSNG